MDKIILSVSLVEDDPDYRELLSCTIRGAKSLRLLSACATGEEALQRFPQEKPAVALVDIKLPGGMDGIACVRQLCAIVPALPTQFIMLTGHEDDNLVFDSLKAGAHGYLLKSEINRQKLIMHYKRGVYYNLPPGKCTCDSSVLWMDVDGVWVKGAFYKVAPPGDFDTCNDEKPKYECKATSRGAPSDTPPSKDGLTQYSESLCNVGISIE